MLTQSLWLYNCFSFSFQPEQKKDDLNATDDRESTEESHSAPNSADLVSKSNAYIVHNLVVGGCAEVDLDHLQGVIG